MSKPREFWLRHFETLPPDDMGFGGNKYIGIDWAAPGHEKTVHVIEYSAYERLKTALEKIDLTLRIPAAESVPAISDVFKIIDDALEAEKGER
jgi:hypothetical protein